MRFSIIVPVHNAEKTLNRCVESLVTQNVDLQLILIENASTDESLDCCRKLENKYPDIEVYSTNIKGVSNARNIGLKYSKGDIIGFCDADDYYDKKSLQHVEKVFQEQKVDLVITGVTYLEKNQRYVKSVKKSETIGSIDAIDNVTCNPVVMGSVWNKFYKRDFVSGILFPESVEYLEDGFFNVAVLSKNQNAKVHVSKNNTYFYVFNGESATNNIDKTYDSLGRLKYNLTLYKELDDLKIPKKNRNSIADSICRISIDNARTLSKSDVQRYNILYDEIKNTFPVFIGRVIRYDVFNRLKYVIKGLIILLQGKR